MVNLRTVITMCSNVKRIVLNGGCELKRIITILLFLCILLVSCDGKQQQSDYLENVIEYVFDVFDMKADSSGNIYIADKSKIHKIDTEGKQITIVDESLGYCRNICIGEDRLYAFDESGCSIKEFTLDGRFLNKYELSENNKYDCIEMEYMEDRIIMLNLDYSNHEKAFIMTYDLKSGSQNIFEINNGINIAVCRDNLLVQELTGIYIYDCITGEKTGERITDGLHSNIYYDIHDELLYCIGPNSIVSVDPEEKIKNTIISADGNKYTQIASTPDFLVIYNSDTSVINYIKKDNKIRNHNRIVIITYYGGLDRCIRFKFLVEQVQKKYPDCEYNVLQIDSENYRTYLNTKIMAGDKDFDIFHCENRDFAIYAHSGAYADLAEYEEIVNNIISMFEGFSNLCMYKGKLVGVPFYRYSIHAWEVNDELNKVLNLEFPERWTYNDFLEFAIQAGTDINGDGRQDTYVIQAKKEYPIFMDQYDCIYFDIFERKADYNNNKFKELLEIWKTMWKRNLIREEFEQEKRDNVLLWTGSNISIQSGDKHFICPPDICEKTVYPISLDLLCLNVNSKKKEYAIEFLRHYISEEVHSYDVPSGFYPGPYEIKKIGDPIVDSLRPDIKFANDRNMDILTHMIKNSSRVPWVTADLSKLRREVIRKYVDDEISVEEAMRLIDEKAKMVVGE